MSAAFYTAGNTLVSYDGSELGYSSEPIVIAPIFYHTNVQADDYGPRAPAAILWDLAEVMVRMTLVYFDAGVYYAAVKASMGGGDLGTFTGAGGILTGASLSLDSSTDPEESWVFPTAFLAEQPFEMPIGNERTLLRLTWRCIGINPAQAEVLSAGAVLFR